MRVRDSEVAYTLKRSTRRRTIAFTVDENGLAVHAPWNSTERRIEHSIQEAADWILKKLEVWSRHETRRLNWTGGAELEYLGRPLQVEVAAQPVLMPPVLVEPGRLRVTVADAGAATRIRDAVVSWYRRHALRNFAERIALYAPEMGVKTSRLALSGAQGRWGSCNSRGEVRLNWRLIQAPQSVIDYVVVIEMNHSKRFWRIVERSFPGQLEAREHLDRRGRWYLAI
jgi:predicted metal-dependent hydrolase